MCQACARSPTACVSPLALRELDLERGAKSVRLTEAGRVFLVKSRAVPQRAEEALSAAQIVAVVLSGGLNSTPRLEAHQRKRGPINSRW